MRRPSRAARAVCHIARHTARRAAPLAAALAVLVAAPLARPATLGAQAAATPRAADPRVGLRAGWMDAGSAIRNLRLVASRPRPEGFVNPANPSDFDVINTDLAFQGRYLFQGSYHGLQVWDVGDAANPTLVTALPCPGGQGDVSVWGRLLFLSVEEPRGRVDCAGGGVPETSSPTRMRGVRIFDISDVRAPKPIAVVQTCRGSHTHTLVPDPKDTTRLFVYISGTGPVRPASELAGCADGAGDDAASSRFRIEVIEVPLANPAQARVVATPRIFADPRTGKPGGLWRGGAHGAGTQSTAETDQCHDITAYPALGLAAGACSGNGILLDIRNPANPVRVAEVTDPNFAYWHSATFSNSGRTVVFSDEWGGGVAPRCRATDDPKWGADALFRLNGRTLTPAGHYKLPAAQTAVENCVAHNGSLIPIPGRDVMVQAWYQGGLSVVDFTDPSRPRELAFFDRGPIDATTLTLGGYWSAYWHDGRIWGSEIARGLDVFELTPSADLTADEIAAAALVRTERANPQTQERLTWPAHPTVARAYLDQLDRSNGLPAARRTAVRRALAAAEALPEGDARREAYRTLGAALARDARTARDVGKVWMLSEVVRMIGGR